MQKLNQKIFKQNGAALIIFVLALVLAATAFLISALDANSMKIQRDKKTASALALAKASLIGYSTAYKYPGALPCPDTNNDGAADTNGNIGCYSKIGRLPWRTLDMGDLRDGNGERLWYVLSANFANVPTSLIINSDDTVALLNICSAGGCGNVSPIPNPPNIVPLPISSQQAAILFSPGTALTGQDRKDGSDTNPNPTLNIDNAKKANNYLDIITVGAKQFSNATGSNNGNDFISSNPTNTFNDRLLPIKTNEMFRNVNKRMQAKATLAGIASCLIEYANNNANNPAAKDKRLPWPAPLVLANYTNQANFDDDVTRYTGRIAYQIASSTSAPKIHNWNIGAAAKKQKMTYCASWPEWWNSWKKSVFYGVSKNYVPSTIAPQTCTGNCVSVDGIGPFAAVLIYSGEKLAGQVRASNNDIKDPLNFLEDKNAIEIANNSGFGDFTKITNATQNDITICIRQNLTIDTACTSP
jgi:type II secretory pathway pseudopilin PulG